MIQCKHAMANDIKKEVLALYFSDDCPAITKNEVENWIAANGENAERVEQWLSNLKIDTVLKILADKEEVWRKILQTNG
ncbi:hypothetical protein [Dyadobacter frigoris]|uniref:Uncharacterized protein n=1 Tax=Dyadobacter frigoris TaxID=2576211 RepID=A0A4U6D9R6_9BACT|nr:hypothetical protein [Dyadobacter frigoris]TKT93415.1 hypothetical protein FDK13_06075 [Dyadobacter frigoris]GLU54727.1 hypothetical protein Dfri01_41880 [Dyadobacter frigoris]